MRSKDFLHGEEGKIGEMFMINRVELILLHETHQMGKFHGDDALGLEQDFHAGDKIINVRDVSQHVVSEQQIGVPAGSDQLASSGAPKKLDE